MKSSINPEEILVGRPHEGLDSLLNAAKTLYIDQL